MSPTDDKLKMIIENLHQCVDRSKPDDRLFVVYNIRWKKKTHKRGGKMRKYGSLLAAILGLLAISMVYGVEWSWCVPFPFWRPYIPIRLLEVAGESTTCPLDEYFTDYALDSLGASVLATPDTKQYPAARYELNVFSLRLPLWDSYENRNGPESALSNDVRVGVCWSFETDKGNIVIKLSEDIIPTSIGIQHIDAKELSLLTSAPKDFDVYAIDEDDKFRIGEFQYLKSSTAIQSFKLLPIKYPIRIIEVRFRSNHGNEAFTCVYKIRIHGTPVN